MLKIIFSLLAAALVLGASSASSATSSSIVVGEIFAGGGNAGAPYSNDYVELFNRGATTVDVGGWSLQYASAASSTWSATTLTGTIPPGGHYLVGLASGGTVGAALPAPDATGTANLAATGGKVAVVNQATPLTCGASAGSCSGIASLQDLVGYGTATDFEGPAPGPALSATTAAVRAGGGCTDTNDSFHDFAEAAPTPQNAAAAATACGAAPSTGPSASVDVGVDLGAAISLALNRSTVGFGNVVPGTTPTPVAVTATVLSNDAAGYALTVHRTAFTPGDLPLAIARNGNPLAAVPVAPAADLALVTTNAASAAAGDAWPTTLGFAAALPLLAPGHYTATVTYTVIGR
jgi:hypothetical protein